jgi:sigma-B regulation protein RsbU (phosphoserine phosphatase)
LHAVDYLLKPVNRTRLAQAVERIRALPSKDFDSALKNLMDELDRAVKVQAQLFPQALPPMKTLDYSAVSKAAYGVGGDYYDFLLLRQHQLCVALGDISGKSISAALLMASLQATLRSCAPLRGAAVAELLADINRLMCSSTDSSKYATFFCGLYDDDCRTLTYVNAGHNPPILLRGDDCVLNSSSQTGADAASDSFAHGNDPQRVLHLATGGTAVGMFWNAVYQQETIQLFPGDILLLFTDGVTEAANAAGEEFGEKGLRELAEAHRQCSAAALSNLILHNWGYFMGNAPQQDDLTLVIAKVI